MIHCNDVIDNYCDICGLKVASISESAFDDCSELKEVIFGNSIENIGKGAFWWCTSLESVTIPDSVKVMNVKVR